MGALSRRSFIGGSLAAAFPAVVSAQASNPVLRVGCAANDDFAQAYYAANTGLFQSAGLNVEIQTLANGAAAADAVIGGSLDIAITTPLLLANGVMRGLPFAIFAAGPISTMATNQIGLCVANDGPIRRAADLAGKTVGMATLHTVLQLGLDCYLAANHVDASSVQNVEIVFSAAGAAVKRGTIAAALILEPFLTAALKDGGLRSLANPYHFVAPNFLLGAWFTNRQFAGQHPDVLRKFAGVMYQTARWAKTHHDESAAILEKYAKIPPDLLHSMSRAQYAERMNLGDMQAVLDVAVRYGLLAKPVRAADLVVTV